MRPIIKRILSAAIMAPITIAALAIGGWPFYAFMVAIFAVSVQEWSRLSFRDGRVSWALLIAGVVYLTLSCLSVVWVRDFESWGFYLLLYVLLAVWACDIGAYMFGRLIGGPKMAPRVSPNKTWAGLIGGCIAAACAIVAYDAWLGTRVASPVAAQFSLPFQILLGLFLGVTGQLGDLMISFLKRKSGVKDTGTLIPGHGGVLDRIDALLLTVPVYALVIFVMDWVVSP